VPLRPALTPLLPSPPSLGMLLLLSTRRGHPLPGGVERWAPLRVQRRHRERRARLGAAPHGARRGGGLCTRRGVRCGAPEARKRCPTKRCAGLIRYEVLRQSDRLPLAEDICPTGAVVKDNGSYRIDQEKCIKCDACREQAPYAIAIVDEFG
jgi:hypothetical protein